MKKKEAVPGAMVAVDRFWLTSRVVILCAAVAIAAVLLGFNIGLARERAQKDHRVAHVEKMITSGSSAFAGLIFSSGRYSVCVNNGGLRSVVLTYPNNREYTFVCNDGAKFEFIKLSFQLASAS